MRTNRLHPHISISNSHVAEKQRFSLRGNGSSGRFLQTYKNQQEITGHDNLSTFWAAIRNARKTISYLFQQRQHPYTTSHPKELSSSPSSHSTLTFIYLCALWYSSSALSSNTGKTILNQFRYPITLTFVQFGFVALYCLLFMSPLIRFSRLRSPTKAILKNTLPMGMFQVGGHMFSSMAISRISVSTVHTIKALSPLFTVAAYALLFGVSYSSKTYMSLLPLTVGVMLACSFDVSASSALGLLCAFGSALVFVSSNIFFKKIMPSNTSGASTSGTSHKLDKLNLLLYSSGMAFLLMIPMWVYYDLPIFLSGPIHPEYGLPRSGHNASHSLTYYFFVNGTVHFGQNIIAFIILSSTSPVTYSIASLIKRVVVICIAIVWFQQSIHPIQGLGILMTFVGLYMYNQSKDDVEKGERKMRRVEAARGLVLPTTKEDSQILFSSGSPRISESQYKSDFAIEATGAGLGSASLYERAKASPSATVGAYHPPFASSHQQTHPIPPGSKIDTNTLLQKPWPPPGASMHVISPVESYPSPPPSRDSLSSRTFALDEQASPPIAVH